MGHDQAIYYFNIFQIASSVGGLVYLLGRLVYAHGYSTGGKKSQAGEFGLPVFDIVLLFFSDPEKRMRGAFGYLGLFTMLGASVSYGLHLLQVL